MAWLNNLATQVVNPEDCLVYFVSGYPAGAAKAFLDRHHSPLPPAMQNIVQPTNFAELGIAVDLQG